ncbi:hypothetical protein PVAND_002425 [Polypedilum vanderplanki]|uniref:Angiotensin-converting enzyme n=1 Tax=Polypedilum vanderplanki TaxID=319348 RepID=A0A9J6BRF2_POLVA|nr:hypothetical protein PVAND_002425 [Polypedilum vanderplanki]
MNFKVTLSLFLAISLVNCDPQLDIPNVQTTDESKEKNGIKVLVLPNSYTNDKFDDQPKSDSNNNRFDSDRSQRYGPPYSSNENDEYPQNIRDNERLRYGDPNSNRDNFKFPQNDFNERSQQSYPVNNNNNNNEQRYGNVEPRYRYENNQRNGYNVNEQYDDRYGNNFNSNYGFVNNQNYNYNNNYNDYQNLYDIENEKRIRLETEKLRQLLIEIDKKHSSECTLNVAAQWNFETNVNEATQLEALTAQQRYSDFMRYIFDQTKSIDQNYIFDEKLYRQLKLLKSAGPAALPADQLDRYNRIINDMLTIYNGATICAYEQPFQCSLRLQPHLRDIMVKSRDWDELTWVWTEWRRKAGKPMRDLFEQLVDLTNDAAKYNNFSNAADYFSSQFDSPNFRYEMENVWQEILPLYELIHAYVRRKLREFYGPDKINRNAPLPAHILGNMYAQTWNILDLTIPYPGRTYLDVTPTMRAQGYNPLIMFQIAEEFFVSMNMSAMPPEFWAHSILEEPVDRPILCQPSAWDFCNGIDYRIKMCTDVTHKDFITVHHELAHIQYFLNYRNNPKIFRDGSNPGFHDAIGDAITLSLTPKHLQGLGLIQKSVDDTAHDINFLFTLAMDKVVFLPYALALEQWRYDIYTKKIRKEQFNCHWWLLREQYGGIKPPVLRSEFDFDPGAKYHIPANVPYMK